MQLRLNLGQLLLRLCESGSEWLRARSGGMPSGPRGTKLIMAMRSNALRPKCQDDSMPRRIAHATGKML
jgi:hypothetical protein